jgi:hypothetical protein
LAEKALFNVCSCLADFSPGKPRAQNKSAEQLADGIK